MSSETKFKFFGFKFFQFLSVALETMYEVEMQTMRLIFYHSSSFKIFGHIRLQSKLSVSYCCASLSQLTFTCSNSTIETLEKRCEICSKLIIKTAERRGSGVFIVNFEHISHLFPLFLLLTLN